MRRLVSALAGLVLCSAVVVTTAVAQSYDQAPATEKTATGTVVSINKDTLVVKTADEGQLTFMMASNVNRPTTLAQGARVRVNYRDENGQRTLTRIEPLPADTATGTATGTTAYAADADLDTDTDPAGSQLPQTASSLPRVGLVGLLALVVAGGAMALRRLF